MEEENRPQFDGSVPPHREEEPVVVAFPQFSEEPLDVARLSDNQMMNLWRNLSRLLSARVIVEGREQIDVDKLVSDLQRISLRNSSQAARLLNDDYGIRLTKPQNDFANALIELSRKLVADRDFVKLMREHDINESVLLLRDIIKKVGELLQKRDNDSKEDARKFLGKIWQYLPRDDFERLNRELLEPASPVNQEMAVVEESDDEPPLTQPRVEYLLPPSYRAERVDVEEPQIRTKFLNFVNSTRDKWDKSIVVLTAKAQRDCLMRLKEVEVIAQKDVEVYVGELKDYRMNELQKYVLGMLYVIWQSGNPIRSYVHVIRKIGETCGHITEFKQLVDGLKKECELQY